MSNCKDRGGEERGREGGRGREGEGGGEGGRGQMNDYTTRH